MATRAKAIERSTRDTGRIPYRFTAAEVLDLAETLRHDAELWDGVLYRLRKQEPHNFAVGQLADFLRALLPADRFTVREEKSCRHGLDSLPEPDVAIARGPRRTFERQPPELAELAFVAEVCGGTERADYGVKLRRYAEVGIRCYWVVHLAARRVDVFQRPQASGESAGYAQRDTFGTSDTIPFFLDEFDALIPVADLLPTHADP